MHASRAFLLILALAAGAAGIAGVNRGWAYAQRTVGETYGPALVIEVELGWWNATTHVVSGFLPGQLKVNGPASRALGTVTAINIIAGLALATYLTVLAFAGSRMPSGLHAQELTQHRLSLLSGTIIVALSIGLYVSLMIETHNRIKDQFHDSIWPRPDWAFLCALASGACLLGVSAESARAAKAQLAGYLPL